MFLLMMFIIPVIQICLTSKRISGNSKQSIFEITFLSMLATIPMSMVTILIGEIEISTRTDIKCDMTIPGMIGLGMLLMIFIIPVTGIVGGCIYQYKNKNAIVESTVVQTGKALKTSLAKSYFCNLSKQL